MLVDLHISNTYVLLSINTILIMMA